MFEGQPINLVLWDTAGQEDYDKLRPLSYPGTDVFIVCFNIVGHDSYENVEPKWVQEINASNPDTPLILVGTKLDLRHDKTILRDLESSGAQPVSPEEGEALRQRINAVAYLECSALTQTGVNEIFNQAIKAVFDKEKAVAAAREASTKQPKAKKTDKPSDKPHTHTSGSATSPSGAHAGSGASGKGKKTWLFWKRGNK
eukprot:TRINITY_DN2004_c0_g1_i2.p1 TRINITY_DN2004_c0_g1~~TRINITY_DN2004_c0_g1_i2.p1  ORF type:complete len:199 (+),score=47.54 TRINITY_DN2004_c0_g1_i2:304-900(+)